MRVNQQGLSEHDNHFIDDQNDPEVPVERTSDFANRFQTIQPIQELQLQHSRRTKGNPLLNLQAVHNLETLQHDVFSSDFVHLNMKLQ